MFKRQFQFCLLFVGLLLSQVLFAANEPTIASIAEKLISGISVLTRFMMVVCMAVGVGFVIVSITTYKAHRANPKFVPLDRPVMYLVLGVVIFAVPFLGNIFGPTGSILDMEKRHAQSCPSNIDAPLELGNEFEH